MLLFKNSVDSNYGIEEKDSVKKTTLGKWALKKYYSAIKSFIKYCSEDKAILEVGCAEGDTMYEISNIFTNTFIALDISIKMLKISKCRNKNIFHLSGSLYSLPFKNNCFHLIICSEVLEHLTDLNKAINELNRVSSKYILISVPNEPFFCIANIVRLRHIARFGSTPGHIQHLTKKKFQNLLKYYFNITEFKTILGIWNVALCEKK